MNKIEDLTGRIFGKLEVIGFAGKDESNSSLWYCRCSCGEIKVFERRRLTRKVKPTTTCGKSICNGNIEDLSGRWFQNTYVIRFLHTKDEMSYWSCRCKCGNEFISSQRGIKKNKSCCPDVECRFGDIKGKTFGNLTAVEFDKRRNGKIYWNCLCKCGRTKSIRYDSLTRNEIRSCGCARLISENELYAILITLFTAESGFEVIRHYRTEWLGRQHIDLVVKNAAGVLFGIEYNGRQHYMPVQYGNISEQEAADKFALQKKRDRRKARLIKEHCEEFPMLIKMSYKSVISIDSITSLLTRKGLLKENG
jgi:hypothetical protein